MNLIQTLEQEEIARLGKIIPEFSPGDTVRFDSRGKRYVGIVKRILVKNIVVQTSIGTYRVPANMLEAA
jgi:ribosomal protein L19